MKRWGIGMRIHPLEIADVLLIELDCYADERGFFCERFHAEKMADLGLSRKWVQDNHSKSHAKVLRGIHTQTNPSQGKLVGVTRGSIWDVAVDLRQKSASFGRYVAAELSEDNHRLLFIPEGFGHGFCVLGDAPADVTYKVTGLYNPKGEYGVRYDDDTLNIAWPVTHPIVSVRDKNLPSLAEFISALEQNL